MNTRYRSGHEGFTLIETLVYLALYALIMVGAMTALYSIFASSARNAEIAMVEEEGNFLVGKIEWVLSNAETIQLPANEGAELDLTREDGSQVALWRTGSSLRIEINGAAPETLNNSNTRISDLSFIHTLPTSDGIDPERIEASFTLHATTSDGFALDRDFKTTHYVRK